MSERRDRFRFALEPRAPLSVAGKRRRQHFDRDVATQPRVVRAVTSPMPPHRSLTALHKDQVWCQSQAAWARRFTSFQLRWGLASAKASAKLRRSAFGAEGGPPPARAIADASLTLGVAAGAHAAGADCREHFIRAEASAGREGHVGSDGILRGDTHRHKRIIVAVASASLSGKNTLRGPIPPHYHSPRLGNGASDATPPLRAAAGWRDLRRKPGVCAGRLAENRQCAPVDTNERWSAAAANAEGAEMKRLAIAVVFVVIARPAQAQKVWTEVKSPHFTAISDSGDRSARAVAWQFEQVREAFRLLWPWANVDLDRPFVTILVRNEDAMKSLAPQYWESRNSAKPGSVSVGAPDRHYVLLRMDAMVGDDRQGRANPYESAYWSYASSVIGEGLGRNLPPWFTRGLAGLMSNTIVTDEGIEVGRVAPDHFEQISYRGRLPLPEMFAADRQSPWLTQGDRQPLFDAQSTVFMHYLVFGDQGAHRESLDRFLKLIADGTAPAGAPAAAFGDPQALQAAFTLYLSKKLFNFSRLPADVKVDRNAFTARTLSALDGIGVEAAFHVAMDRPIEARQLATQARKADPTAAVADEIEGLLLDRETNKRRLVRPTDARRTPAQQTSM